MQTLFNKSFSRLPVFFIAIFILAGIPVILITPYGSFPDEQNHFGYAAYLREHARLPELSFDAGRISVREAFQPPLYYLAASVLIFPGATQKTDVVVLRFFSLFLGAATLFLIYRSARLIADQNAALIATGFAAFNPQFLYTHAGVSNISITSFTCALTLYAALRDRARGSRLLLPAFILGLFLGLALLSRTIAIYLIPVCLASLLLPFRKTMLHGKETAVKLALFFAGAFVVAGWWYIRNWVFYEDPFLFKLHQSTVGANWVRDEPVTFEYCLQNLAFLHASFWAYFGRNEFHAGIWEYAVYLLMEALAVFGIVETLFRSSSNEEDTEQIIQNRQGLFLVVLAGVLAITEVLLLQVSINSPQGRYFYIAISPIAILSGLGLVKIAPPAYRKVFSLSVCGFLFCLSIYLFATVWLPHYR